MVSGREPSIGYLCLAEAVMHGKVKSIWTTNFDSLLENALTASIRSTMFWYAAKQTVIAFIC